MTTALPRMKKRTRAQRRADNTELFWQAKYERANGPEATAAIAWDRLRKAVGKVPAEEQAAAWREVIARLEGARADIEDQHAP